MAEFKNSGESDAASLLRESRAHYAKLTSYRDRGEVEFRLADPMKVGSSVLQMSMPRSFMDEPMVTQFRSWFRKPADLRFEWISHHPYPPLRHIESCSVIWAGRTGAYISVEGQPEHHLCESPGLAVASATGVSMGSASHFAPFFMRIEDRSAPLECFPDPGVVEEEIEGTSSWKVIAHWLPPTADERAESIRACKEYGLDEAEMAKTASREERRMVLYIAKQDLLVRRIHRGTNCIETRREIEVDLPLPDNLFVNCPGVHRPWQD